MYPKNKGNGSGLCRNLSESRQKSSPAGAQAFRRGGYMGQGVTAKGTGNTPPIAAGACEPQKERSQRKIFPSIRYVFYKKPCNHAGKRGRKTQ